MDSRKLIANNKKARHDYFLEELYEAGVSLHGTEVKSLRMGKCSIKEAFVRIENGEVIVYGMHISPYEKGNIFNKDPSQEASAAQEGDFKAAAENCGKGVYAGSGGSIFERKPGKSAACSCERQKAL